MKLWLACSLFALAQASCYDYEYYDPDTGASLGNACGGSPGAAPGAAGGSSSGQPLTPPGATVQKTTTVSTSTQVSAAAPAAAIGFPTVAAAPVASTVYSSAPVYGGAPVAAYGTVAAPAVVGTPVYGAPVASTAVYTAPVATGAVYTAPVAATVATTRAVATTSAAGGLSTAEAKHLEQVGQENAQLHRRNDRDVRQATENIQRGTILNDVIAGSGATTSWFPLYRLGQQKNEEQAYRSEDRIAARDANIAYQQYQQHPTQLNLLVSKYQDLNADLHDAAHHYNVINSGTFGQAIGSGLFGGLSSKLLIPQIATQQSENNDLKGIQRRMKRVAREIQSTVRAQKSTTASTQANANAPQQNTVQQRMMALSVYGPNRG